MSTIDRDLNNGLPSVWSGACAPGGYVCGVPDPGRPDGICGMPVESEPCSIHAADEPEPDEPDDYDPGPECDDIGGMSEYRYPEPESWQ